jgi:hypothetical protein
MSGRLVILRHKSWNVWNQDNREKVLRDERLHREALETAEEREKQKLQEKTYSKLNELSAKNDNDSAVKPFRLFEDLELAEANFLGNEEYLKEKEAFEKRKRKRDGLEEWKLGDGSLEVDKRKPWYEDPSRYSEQRSNEKDELRKQEEDPMSKYLQTRNNDDLGLNESKTEIDDASRKIVLHSYGLIESNLLTHHYAPNIERFSDSTSSRKRKEKKKEKKTKTSKKERKSKKEKSGKSKTREECSIQDFPLQLEKRTIDFDELRRRRLNREVTENRRENQLRAEVDIYGHNL